MYHSTYQALTPWQVLFICKDEEQAISHLSITQDTMKLLLCFVYSVTILAVDDKDETLSAGIVVPPQRPNLVLPANVLQKGETPNQFSFRYHYDALCG